MKQCNILSEEDYSYAAAATMYRYHTHSSDINIPCALQELQKIFIIININIFIDSSDLFIN